MAYVPKIKDMIHTSNGTPLASAFIPRVSSRSSNSLPLGSDPTV